MGVMDKFLSYMKLNNEEDDYDDYEEDEYEQPVERVRKMAVNDYVPAREPEERPRRGSASPSKVTPLRSVKKSNNASSGMEVCVIKPTSIEDAREITETLLSNRAVVLNLENIDLDVAQRIIDFTCGSTYAISGNLQKISNHIFIVTPASVDISGDFQELLSGSFNVPIH